MHRRPKALAVNLFGDAVQVIPGDPGYPQLPHLGATSLKIEAIEGSRAPFCPKNEATEGPGDPHRPKNGAAEGCRPSSAD